MEQGGDAGRPSAAILKGGDVTLLVSERAAGPEADFRPAHVAIQVHKLAPTVSELRRRGQCRRGSPRGRLGVRMATVWLGAPAHL